MEIQPSSRYVLCGLDGMFEGRWPDLRHASHSLKLFSFSFRTIVLAAAKGSMPLARASTNSKGETFSKWVKTR